MRPGPDLVRHPAARARGHPVEAAVDGRGLPPRAPVRGPRGEGDGVRPADLAGERFVAFDRKLPVRRAVDRFLRRHRVEVTVTAEFDNIETIKQAVDEEAGIAILPEPTLRREVRRGTLVQTPLVLPPGEPPLVRPLSIVHRSNRRLNPAVTAFIELLGADAPAAATTPRTRGPRRTGMAPARGKGRPCRRRPPTSRERTHERIRKTVTARIGPGPGALRPPVRARLLRGGVRRPHPGAALAQARRPGPGDRHQPAPPRRLRLRAQHRGRGGAADAGPRPVPAPRDGGARVHPAPGRAVRRRHAVPAAAGGRAAPGRGARRPRRRRGGPGPARLA